MARSSADIITSTQTTAWRSPAPAGEPRMSLG
jgi:hypothetical protein